MTGLEELRTELDLPSVSQIGFVVRDVERTVGVCSSVFGFGPWAVYEFVPEQYWFMEEPDHLKLKMGKTMLGDMELVYAQPLDGRCLHREFLETGGEGVHSLTVNVEDYDEIFSRFIAAGFEPVMRAETYVETYGGDLRACYFDTRSVCATLLEIRWASWSVDGRRG